MKKNLDNKRFFFLFCSNNNLLIELDVLFILFTFLFGLVTGEEGCLYAIIGGAIVAGMIHFFIMDYTVEFFLVIGGIVALIVLGIWLSIRSKKRAEMKRNAVLEHRYGRLAEANKPIQIGFSFLSEESKAFQPIFETIWIENDKVLKKQDELTEVINKNFFTTSLTLEDILERLSQYTDKRLLNERRLLNHAQNYNLFYDNGVSYEYLKEFKENCQSLLASRKGLKRGEEGEDSVVEALKIHRHQLTMLSSINLRLEDGTTAENDIIVICKQGLFTLEIKNYSHSGNGERTIGITSDGKYFETRNGRMMESGNIMVQVERHIASLNQLVSIHLKPDYPELAEKIKVRGLVAIANTDIDIQNDYPHLPMIRTNAIYHEIMAHEEVLTEAEMTIIKNVIEANKIPLNKFQSLIFSDEKTTLDGLQRLLDYKKKQDAVLANIESVSRLEHEFQEEDRQ